VVAVAVVEVLVSRRCSVTKNTRGARSH
jgi:hypothetical protein